MSASDDWKLLIFRDGKRVVNGRALLRELSELLDQLLSIADFHCRPSREYLIEALLRAGELECGLADCDPLVPSFSHSTLEQFTDVIADALVGGHAPTVQSSLLQAFHQLEIPASLTLSAPEGFCYYALHPLDYCDLLDSFCATPSAAAVVGIRSIGTTLSAVVAAWFRARGVPAQRITVRPTGHPFDRSLAFTTQQREWIRQHRNLTASFFVVDEGPGLSGSSFLAVAEALEREGVAAEAIVLLPSSDPDLGSLIAPNAAERWRRFQYHGLKPTRYIPDAATHDLSAGKWRERVFSSQEDWPPVWSWTERRKYLSADHTRLFRFDGHGHYGARVRKRAEILAENGWGPKVQNARDGFSECRWLPGRPPASVSSELLARLAGYCAFRAEAFGHESTSQTALEEMARINLERTIGASVPVSLPVERSVVPDARMMPQEWLIVDDNRLMKLDAASHGDDHFYPGATDIAWDIAGTIVEWELSGEGMQALVSSYEELSGDKMSSRLPDYLLAYSAFRLAFMLSAEKSVADSAEKARFLREAGKYRAALQRLMRREKRAVALFGDM